MSKVESQDKFAPHTQAELVWAEEMHNLDSYFKGLGLDFQRGVRLGRQVKAYGSNGVAEMHVYLHPDNTWELWVNGNFCEEITKQVVVDYIHQLITRVNGNPKKRNNWTKQFRLLTATYRGVVS